MRNHLGTYRVPFYGGDLEVDVSCSYTVGHRGGRYEPPEPPTISGVSIIVGLQEIPVETADILDEPWFYRMLENIAEEIETDES